jgi:hypothetical protein
MFKFPRRWQSAPLVTLVALGCTLTGCADNESVLTDEDARSLVERVLAGLDLPGEREPQMDPSDIPEGELEFGFHCQIQSAGFAVEDVLVAFPPAAVGHEEFADGDIERVEVSLLVFDKAASASAVLAVYVDESTIGCLNGTFPEPIQIEVDDPLEVDGLTADGFAFTIGVGGIQPEGHRTFAGVVGRILVDVTVLAPDEPRGRELAAEVLGDIVNDLRAGGA